MMGSSCFGNLNVDCDVLVTVDNALSMSALLLEVIIEKSCIHVVWIFNILLNYLFILIMHNHYCLEFINIIDLLISYNINTDSYEFKAYVIIIYCVSVSVKSMHYLRIWIHVLNQGPFSSNQYYSNSRFSTKHENIFLSEVNCVTSFKQLPN